MLNLSKLLKNKITLNNTNIHKYDSLNPRFRIIIMIKQGNIYDKIMM